jgi:hypothetical protein
MTAPRTAALAAAIRRSIITGQETPGQMAERILADPQYVAEAAAPLRDALRGLVAAWDASDKEAHHKALAEARRALDATLDAEADR